MMWIPGRSCVSKIAGSTRAQVRPGGWEGGEKAALRREVEFVEGRVEELDELAAWKRGEVRKRAHALQVGIVE